MLNLYTCTLLTIHLQLRQIEKDAWSLLHSDEAVVIATAEANAILETIASVKNKVTKWPNSLSPDGKYMTIQLPLDDSIDLWSTDAHIYPTFSAWNDWSLYRTLRILIHSLRLRAYRLVATPFYNYGSARCGYGNAQLVGLASDIARAHIEIQALTADICASMPYHLGYRTKSGSGNWEGDCARGAGQGSC
ncbi:hypothetical protein BDW59DRAFT_158119 [Aspergillus cavernicola]|uniref:Uncharacterized protein n=1 Tax=Aspergillus cavernicola TaxID=176166 RepID=A0ABR4ITS7_9EURO